MSDPDPSASSKPTMITFREGGWLILVTCLVIIALLVWALAPALFRQSERPPGDGENIESYQFDLSNPRVDTATIEMALLYRDMIPVEDEAIILTPEEAATANSARKPYLISKDLVIGVVVDGQPRAYPLSILNVHEIIHDEINDKPIAVTWHWPSAATRVFKRRIGGNERMFGVSGLVASGNLLIYPRRLDGLRGDEPLISQALGKSITGPDIELETVPHELVTWDDWLARYPRTTVAAARPELKNRYKKGKPDVWFASEDLMFSTPVPENGPPPKSHMLLLRSGDQSTIVGLDQLIEMADESGNAVVQHGDERLTLTVTEYPPTARLAPEHVEAVDSMRILWINGRALLPDSDLASP
ncbi:MAG: hypothetical protein CMJ40_02535 [Phycisphaerae bacterium]|nr:hypothetical protein [Phycisphaerae bacterium]|tara:strand:+ start:347 stop:1423 length:1077 start_codon:yes stop_codon:yes gene_type:complete